MLEPDNQVGYWDKVVWDSFFHASRRSTPAAGSHFCFSPYTHETWEARLLLFASQPCPFSLDPLRK